MKKIYALLLPLFLQASDEQLYQKIDSLERELFKLKTDTSLNTQDIRENTDILENVEKKTILDKINFSPEMLLRFDQFDYTTGKIEGENTQVHDSTGTATGIQRRDEFSKHYTIASFVRFRLNMNATIDENVKFYGRLLYMNSSQSNQRLCILSHDIKTGTAGSAFDTDRAYIDYKTGTDTTFSFGILPKISSSRVIICSP